VRSRGEGQRRVCTVGRTGFAGQRTRRRRFGFTEPDVALCEVSIVVVRDARNRVRRTLSTSRPSAASTSCVRQWCRRVPSSAAGDGPKARAETQGLDEAMVVMMRATVSGQTRRHKGTDVLFAALSSVSRVTMSCGTGREAEQSRAKVPTDLKGEVSEQRE
jgi:hypothetical protein